MERILFYLLSIIILVFAISAVSSRKMLRSVIYLLFVLCAIAGLYFMVDYNFLAAVQLTVYAGGIVVLMIFSVMLVHHIDMEMEVARKTKQALTAALCLSGVVVFLFTIYQHPFASVPTQNTITVAEVGTLLLDYQAGGFILPFEVISVLLLAVMIGGIVIAKAGKKPQEKTPKS
ncbi:MAG: NADH-quinone oxidoreductase subunit J [Flavobacteriaceae bacterium]|nr:NADH-quinone oxidoreductase subunit J [Flavobacteriaceae bacterium]